MSTRTHTALLEAHLTSAPVRTRRPRLYRLLPLSCPPVWSSWSRSTPASAAPLCCRRSSRPPCTSAAKRRAAARACCACMRALPPPCGRVTSCCPSAWQKGPSWGWPGGATARYPSLLGRALPAPGCATHSGHAAAPLSARPKSPIPRPSASRSVCGVPVEGVICAQALLQAALKQTFGHDVQTLRHDSRVVRFEVYRHEAGTNEAAPYEAGPNEVGPNVVHLRPPVAAADYHGPSPCAVPPPPSAFGLLLNSANQPPASPSPAPRPPPAPPAPVDAYEEERRAKQRQMAERAAAEGGHDDVTRCEHGAVSLARAPPAAPPTALPAVLPSRAVFTYEEERCGRQKEMAQRAAAASESGHVRSVFGLARAPPAAPPAAPSTAPLWPSSTKVT